MHSIFKFFLPFFAIAAILFLSGCKQQDDYKVTENGLKYKIHVLNKFNKRVQLYDVVEVNMNYRSKDSVLYSGGNEKIPFQIAPVYDGDLMEGIRLMHLNDSATFVLKTSDFFLKVMYFDEIPEYALNYDELFFDIKVVSITPETPEVNARRLEINERKKSEPEKISDYLKQNNIDVNPTQNGLYIVPLQKGSGQQAVSGAKVKVHFASFFLDGTPYLSSYEKERPVFFTVGESKVIAAMEEAILTMKVGDKVKLIIPSSLAYGGVQRDEVKPYTPLIFEMELLETK